MLNKLIFDEVDIEVSGIIFNINNKTPITLLSVYIPPAQNIKLSHLNQLLVSNNLILAGDFNAKHTLWGSPANDFRGRTIEIFLSVNNLVCLNNGEGTRINYNGTLSHLDLTICTSNLSSKLDTDILNDNWGSDHYPTVICMNTLLNKNDPLDSVKKFIYKKANWDLFKVFLESNFHAAGPISDIEEAYSYLLTSFTKARDISVPSSNKNVH